MVQTECRAPGHPQHREMWAGFQTTGCGSLTRGSGSAISRCWKRARPQACPSPPSSAAGTTTTARRSRDGTRWWCAPPRWSVGAMAWVCWRHDPRVHSSVVTSESPGKANDKNSEGRFNDLAI